MVTDADRSRFLRLTATTLAVTVGVILWGAFVRASGSGAGCGSHWPLCNGQVVPRAPTAATLIELSHRLTSGAALLLVVVVAVRAFRIFPRRHPARGMALATVFFMLMEAAVGAALVLFELVADNASMARAMFMAVHLVNTFFLLAAMTLTLHAAATDIRPAWRALLRGPGLLLLAALLGCLAVGASGAVAALGDTLYPAGSLEQALAQDLSASSHLLIRLRLAHPLLAVAVAVVILVAAAWSPRQQDPKPATAAARRWLGRLVLVQVALGFVNVLLLAPIPLQLVHLLLADAVWIALVVVAASSLAPVPRAAPLGERVWATSGPPTP